LLSGSGGVDDVKLGIDAQRLLQPGFGLGCLSQPARDHAGVEEQKSIARTRAQRIVDRIARLLVPPVLVQCPGQCIPSVDVVAYFELLVRQGKRLIQLDIVVRVKEREIAIVQHLVNVAEHPNVFHQLILLLRFGEVAGPGIQVSQFGHVHRHGHNGDGALVQLDGFGVAALAAPELPQPGQSAIVAGVNVEGVEIGIVGCGRIARLELVLAQFEVEPGKIFRG
jgi:hypothetical protein